MHNIFASKSASDSFEIAGQSFAQVVARLDTLLMVLKSCKREECRNPWKVIHPDGDVKGLEGALAKNFDAFYEAQPKVSFTKCELGYLRDSEGPQLPNTFGQSRSGNGDESENAGVQGTADTYGKQKTFQYHGQWSLWI